MATLDDYGLTPDVLMRIEKNTRTTRRIMEQAQPLLSIIDRQQAAMEIMRRSYEHAMRLQPPIRTRQQLAEIVHQLQSKALPPLAPPLSEHQAEQALAGLLPQTPDEVDEVTQSVGEIEQNPEYMSAIRRIVDGIDWGVVAELGAWGALVLVARYLYQVADLPVTAHLSPDQTAALQNRLVVLGVLVVMAQIIVMMRRR
jgi:hypothetical protein